MLITHPNDGRGLQYHIVNLIGKSVLIYQSLDAALRSREGDQRIFVRNADTGTWLTGKPGPIVEAPIDVISKDGDALQNEIANMLQLAHVTPQRARDEAGLIIDLFMRSRFVDAGIRDAYQSLPDA
jgi:hypothetical protein